MSRQDDLWLHNKTRIAPEDALILRDARRAGRVLALRILDGLHYRCVGARNFRQVQVLSEPLLLRQFLTDVLFQWQLLTTA
jgi:hypothetical protein